MLAFIDPKRIKTYPIRERENKVKLADLSEPNAYKASVSSLRKLFPEQLKSVDLLKVVDAIVNSRQKGASVMMAMGAHVIKCGLSKLIIDLMKRKVITSLSFNGAGSIHDFELALCGETSEDVAKEIKEGRFGMVEETGSLMNAGLKKHVSDTVGYGEAIGRTIIELDLPHKEVSLFAQAVELGIPVTVHVAIGNDIIHMHPSADGAVLGQGSFTDFRLFTALLKSLPGGVYMNVGSSVLLPEVFLKALSVVRNVGYDVSGFTAVNFDMIQQYRSNMNVVNRPTEGSEKGFSITGHHEITLPLLYALLIDALGMKA